MLFFNNRNKEISITARVLLQHNFLSYFYGSIDISFRSYTQAKLFTVYANRFLLS